MGNDCSWVWGFFYKNVLKLNYGDVSTTMWLYSKTLNSMLQMGKLYGLWIVSRQSRFCFEGRNSPFGRNQWKTALAFSYVWQSGSHMWTAFPSWQCLLPTAPKLIFLKSRVSCVRTVTQNSQWFPAARRILGLKPTFPTPSPAWILCSQLLGFLVFCQTLPRIAVCSHHSASLEYDFPSLHVSSPSKIN